jgi:putative transcriptional regulator
MSKKAFDQIAEGLEEAIAVARGEAKPFRLHVPAEIDVKAIRVGLGMTQRDFAWMFGFGLDQVKQWEQGRSRPLDGSRAYLLLIQRNPEQVAKMLSEIRAAQTKYDDAPKRAHG